jgi:UDP-N-acetylmuramate dehydrogenase
MLERSVSLKNKNTFGFDVGAMIFCSVPDKGTLEALWKTNLLLQSSPLVLGGGSNILFTRDYPGLVLQNALSGKRILKETNTHIEVEIASGENWHQTVLWAVEQGFGGIENLSLIPGSAGAAPIQNIGAYGVELEQVFLRLEAFDILEGKYIQLKHNECRFGYRDSIFKHEGKGRFFITSMVLQLHKTGHVNTQYGDIQQTLEIWGIAKPGIAHVSKAVTHIRQTKLPDPAVIGNCGSFFKNPVIAAPAFELLREKFPDIRSFPAAEGSIKVPAAWLIEQCGWKGHRRGDAGVHEKQALVLVNYGHATGQEIYTLALEIQQSVSDKFGISLEMEVNIR